MPKVTVAIPTYNREEYLKDCIQSVLNQVFQDFEIIIFDNHSDYDINKLVEAFNDSRIKLIVNKENFGALKNFEQIFNYDHGSDYFVVFHDDDTMHPSLLLEEVHLLDKDKEVFLVLTGLHPVNDSRMMLNFCNIDVEKNIILLSSYSDLIRLILKDFTICFDSVMYRGHVFNDINEYWNIFDKWCDRPYVIDNIKGGRAVMINDKLINYRIHLGQGSQLDHSGEFHYFINLFNYYKDNLQQPLSESDKKLFYSWSTNNGILAISWFSDNPKECFELFKQLQKNGLFKIKYINIKGLYYVAIVISGWLKNFFIKK